MKRTKRSDDWGFPRWRAYEQERQPESVRICDREDCAQRGDCPAPKSPWTQDRFWFCKDHAAEYNRSYNYFAGLDDEEAMRQAQAEAASANAWRGARAWDFSEGDSESGLTRAQLRAYATLELDPTATSADVKSAYRRLAKIHHPDRNPRDADARTRFDAVQGAYDALGRP